MSIDFRMRGRLRTRYLLAGGDACVPGQALLVLCSWATSSLLLHYFFTTPSLLLHYSFATTRPSLILRSTFARPSLILRSSSDRTSLLWSFIHTKSADLELLIHNLRPSHYPFSQINNQKPTRIWQHKAPIS